MIFLFSVRKWHEWIESLQEPQSVKISSIFNLSTLKFGVTSYSAGDLTSELKISALFFVLLLQTLVYL